MFNLVFIRKYKKDVKGYINRVYEPSAFERAFMNAFSIPFGSAPKKVVREEPKPSVEEDEVISAQKPMESVATAPTKPRSVGRYSINVSELIQESYFTYL